MKLKTKIAIALVIVIGLALLYFFVFTKPAKSGGMFIYTGTGYVYNSDDTVYFCEVDVSPYTRMSFKFQITAVDTVRSDTMNVALQTSPDQSTWTTIYTITKLPAGDTVSSNLKDYAIDSIINIPIQRYLRGMLSFGDTTRTSSEDMYLSADGTPALWTDSPDSSADYKVVNDSGAVDTTTDYLKISGADSIEVLSPRDHGALRVKTVDSVKTTITARYVTALATFKIGYCLADTSRCIWGSTQTLTAGAVSYTFNSAVNPNSVAWTLSTVDSLLIAFYCPSVTATGSVRVYKVLPTIYYEAAEFQPAVAYKCEMNLKE